LKIAATTLFAGEGRANATLYWLAASIPVGYGAKKAYERAGRRM